MLPYMFDAFLGPYHQIFGPSDVGGQCPMPSYKYREEGIDYCCCGSGCCWNRCTRKTPPDDCLQNIPNSQWIYTEDHDYFQAFQSGIIWSIVIAKL